MALDRIGIFGGTFDPVHRGHLLVARAALEEAGLDRLFFIPASRSPFKESQQPSAGKDRVRWLRLALAGESRYEIDERELDRGGISYAIDTVHAYQKQFPDAQLCYLIGADHLQKLHQWRDAPKLASVLEFLVVPRPGEVEKPIPAPFRGTFLSGFPCSIAASAIRKRVRSGQSIGELVPSFVEQDIVNRGIYL
jgi:nicotinate-nucleotide adenylyltransferase